MADSTFNLFGPLTKDDVRVGYISTDRGYINGVSICQANVHAKKNPGETFIYKPQRNIVQFLTINEVNRIGEDPSDAGRDRSCPDGLQMDGVPSPLRAVFMGGGGVGVVGNPVVSDNGQVMAVHLIDGGFGYKYPPLVQIRDDTGIGAGAVISVGVGTVADKFEYYTDKEDFEEYNLCTDVFTDPSKSDGGKDSKDSTRRSAYGRRWSPSGKDLGPWVPQNYTDDTEEPFEDVIDEYIKQLNESGKDWWTTRKEPPLKVTAEGVTTKSFYKVQHWTWGPGSATPFSEVPFEIHWHSPHRKKALGFEFVARDKSHSFRIVDTSKKDDGSRTDVYQVRENVTYDIKVIGKRPGPDFKSKQSDKINELAEMGLLKKLGAGRLQKDWKQLDANEIGEGDKIFADFLDTLDDDDDIQVQAHRGRFKATKPRKTAGLRKDRTTYNLTYRLETGRQELAPSFMNTYAISPKPPSNVKGSDFAGRWFTFEWDIDFPYDGDYIIQTARDWSSRIYLDSESYTDKLVTNTGTNPGGDKRTTKTGHRNKVSIKKGLKRLRLDLYNQPEMGLTYDQQPPSPSKSQIVFNISTGSMFANGVRIEGLDINESKPFTPVSMGQKGQLRVTHTRQIEYGKKYKVVFTSKGKGGVQGDIKYNNLHPRNNPIRVVRGGRRIELVDGSGSDTNFALDIDSGRGKFSNDGKQLQGSGNIRLTASWKDKTNVAGVAVDSVQIAGKTWRRSRTRGSQTHTINVSSARPNIKLRTQGPNVIQMEDFTDNDWTDVIVTASGGQFTDLKGNVAYFSVPYPPKKVGRSESGTLTVAEVFNTIDYINKANRKLWRTNVYERGGFLNDYGICPFDTNIQLKDNPYAGEHQIVWPNVNFPIDGNYDIEVAVDDNVKIQIGDQVKIDKKGFIGDTDVSTGTLKLTRFIKQGTYNITADLYQKPGGAYSFRDITTGKEVERIDPVTGLVRKFIEKVQKTEVTFNITTSALFPSGISIPGLFSIGKLLGNTQRKQTIIKQVESDKEYDIILPTRTFVPTGVRIKIEDKGTKLKMEEWVNNVWEDLKVTVSGGEFYNIQGNRCKFRVNRSLKGINPMALAINIESTFTAKKEIVPKSWNENPMGVALTIEAPPPPIPQEPVPKAEGRCPNNPYWTTRFPGAKERWYPVRYDGWGKLLNDYGISPLPPYDEDRQPLVDVPFEVYWNSPHRDHGLGYRFRSQDGSHSFTILDSSSVMEGQRTETHKVKLNTTYNVKAIGTRAHAQGSKISKNGPLGKAGTGSFDNSKVIELAEQGLLRQMGAGASVQEWKTDRLDANRSGTGDKIFADFLDTLDDADDLQIQAGAGQFTASNARTVDSLRGTRTTYDLTYRVNRVPPNDAGNFTNSWTKSFDFGGWFKVQMEADDIGELWIDDEKVIDLDRRRKKTFDEKLIWIDGPTSDEEFRKKGPTNHDIKVVVENFKSQIMKTVNAKVFNTMDWIGGGTVKPQKKVVRFRITSGSMFANSISIPELGIHESKPFTPPTQGQRGQINVTREKEVEVNKVYDVEFSSNNKGSQKNWGLKYVGLNSLNNVIKVRRNNKRIELKDGRGNDTNASLTIDSGNVKFTDDGKGLVVKGNEATFTFDWNDNPNVAGRAVQSIQIGGKTWRITRARRGSITKTVQFSTQASPDNTSNIRLRNRGESVVQMEDHTDNDWTDIQCAATEGRFFDFNGNRCKYVVGSATKSAGGIAGGTTKDGVTYEGPHLFHYTDSRWGRVMNKEGVSPIASPGQSLSDPNENILGWKILTWKNVNFPQTGRYEIVMAADNNAKLFIDGKQMDFVQDNYRKNDYDTTSIEEIGKGNHDIRVELFNANHRYRNNSSKNDRKFLSNPTGVALKITTRMTVGTGTYKSWKENPLGVSAKLIPPPCPKPIKGKGTVVDPVVLDPGNGYPRPKGPGYPVLLKMKPPIIKDGGINYDCSKDTIRLEPSNGVKLSLCQCGPFGRVEKVCIEGEGGPDDGTGYFTEPPEVIIDSPTGVNLDIALQFEVVVAPPDIPDIIQVTDLVGLKRTGYYKGKPYYGAVFYENGIKYSGWYKTAGEMVQVYDTMQESIDATVTTPPSAILRQGSDVTSNDPNLNIPGTPENLT